MPDSQTPPLTGGRPELGSVTLFSALDKSYTVDDAIAFGASHGFLDAAIAETLTLAAAENLVEPDAEAVQRAAERFRYEHELITAGETEQWLADRGMTTDDFGGWLYQSVCAESANATADGEVPDDFPDLFRIHLWLSGAMDQLSREMSRRVAAGIETAGALADDDAAFAHLVAEKTDEAARQRQLSARRMPLTRIELDSLEVESLSAAREAVMCVRADHTPLAEVAREAGFRAKRQSLWSPTSMMRSPISCSRSAPAAWSDRSSLDTGTSCTKSLKNRNLRSPMRPSEAAWTPKSSTNSSMSL